LLLIQRKLLMYIIFSLIKDSTESAVEFYYLLLILTVFCIYILLDHWCLADIYGDSKVLWPDFMRLLRR
jgi:hypothetical protein